MAKTNSDDENTTLKVALAVGLVFAIAIAATAWAIIVGLDGRPGSPSNDQTEQQVIDRRLELVN